MTKLLDGSNITLGTCYYPEHWGREMWADDLCRMGEAGIKVVRVAEFAWSKIEPREGEYTYEFFDDFLELAEKMGMRVIFCTPTATPPAWLTEAYPEVLNATRDGVLIHHGSRRHYNYNSPVYREYCANIVEHIARHYAGHPAIIGWQIDNEFNCENWAFYSESDTFAFRRFLKEKYGTVERLNEAWGTVFWNQTYTAFSEVYVPRRTNTGAVNPHLELDYIRFISESVCSFAAMQADILRKYLKPGDFITTNGMFGRIDNHELTRDNLDFYTYDCYPNFGYCVDGFRSDEPMKDRWWSRNLTEVRSISPKFGIMEQQSGANGWNVSMEAPTPRPGQMTLWTMQSIAHGADYISYFRWRTCPFGTEMYWHGILDYSGRENRRLLELKEIAKKLDQLQEVAGGRYDARVAILRDYDNVWDAEVDHWHGRIQRPSEDALFVALQQRHIMFDYVYLDDFVSVGQLARYSMLFYPHPEILTPQKIKLLENYVAAGGKIVFGCRTGQKDQRGFCVTEKLPGLASYLTGTDVPEYSLAAPDEADVRIVWDGVKLTAPIFRDMLAAVGENVEVLARYEGGCYAGEPALICNSFGAGKAYYYGSTFDVNTVKYFLDKLSVTEPLEQILCVPETCEFAVRRKDAIDYIFVLNYAREEAKITLNFPLDELFSGEKEDGEIILPGYGVKVYRRSFKLQN